jgi:PAS domain S-box-containing protein
LRNLVETSKLQLIDYQKIARLGHYSFDLISGLWSSSEVLDEIFGIDQSYDRSLAGWLGIVHPDWQPDMGDYVANHVIGEKNPFDKEYQIIRISDQQERWVHGRGRLDFDPSGNPIRLQGTIIDITERKAGEMALKKSNDRFMTLSDALPQFLAYMNAETLIYEYVNETYLTQFGKSADEIIGKPIWELIGSEGYNYALPYIERARSGRMANYLNTFKLISGIRWVEIRFIPILNDLGKADSIVVLGDDITERKTAEQKLLESEERYRILVEALPNSVIVHRKGKIEFANESSAKLIGATDASELIGKPVLEFLHPDYRAMAMERVKSALAEWKPLPPAHEKFIRKDGSVVDVEVNAVPLAFKGEPAMLTVSTDITQRRIAEEELIQSRAKLQLTVDEAPIGVAMVGLDNRFIFGNKAFCRFIGYNEEEIREKTISEITYPEDRQIGMEDMAQIVNGSKSTAVLEKRYVRKDGGVVWGEVTISLLRNHRGKPLYFLPIIQDINNRKIAQVIGDIQVTIAREVAVKEELEPFILLVRKQLSRVIDTSNFILALYDDKTEVLRKVVFLDERDDFIEWKAEGTFSGFVAKSAKPLLMNREEAIRFARANQINMMGTPSECWLGVPLQLDQTVIGVMVVQSYTNPAAFDQSSLALMELVAQEVSHFLDRRKIIDDLVSAKEVAEAGEHLQTVQKYEIELNNLRLESLLKISQFQTTSIQELLDFALEEAIQLTNSKIGYIYFYNETTRQFTLNTWSKEVMDECRVANPQTVYDLDSTGCWGEAVRQRKTIVMNNYAEENPIKKGIPQGHVSLIKFLTIPVFSGGKIVAVAGVANKNEDYNNADIRQLNLLMDAVWKISERISLIHRLEKEKEKAEQSDRLKSAFLANMSHEIRTPMNAILGFTDLLLEPELGSKEKENYIKIVHKSGQRMLNTVNDIIEISKIEAGLVDLKYAKTDLNNRIQEIVQFFTPEANKKGVTLFVETLLPQKECCFATDQNKLDSILTNLIKNALKFTYAGTIAVGCNLKSPFVEFYVKDTGIGIPKHRWEAIFNRFEQADIDHKKASEGSGLGLAICKSYVEMLGGKIWVLSEVGKGSSFHFTIRVLGM